ncbi:MAG: hypothetical protein IPN34_07510 [Planctomycetes bacterium]|nr:hypothetical protein [Planctomycetota bacterium]
MSARRTQRRAWIAALGLAGCSAAPGPAASDPRPEPRDPLRSGTVDPRIFLVDGPVFVAPPSIEAAVRFAREARWPLPEPPEAALAAIAASWRAEVQRVLYARGLALAGARTDASWIVELKLNCLGPSTAWLNAVGAEDVLAAAEPSSTGLGYDYAIRAPGGTRELRTGHGLELLAGKREEAWSRAGERELLASAAHFAAMLSAARSEDQ